MSRRARMALVMGGSLAGVALLAGIAGVLVLQSQWFREKVRERLVAEVERATGGRSQIGSFSFDWRALRAEVRDFVLHGSEAEGQPPLFQARSITVEIKIVSLLKQQFDLAYLSIKQPSIYLIVYPDGRTNVPAPKVRRLPGKPTLETILDLAVRRFQIDDGMFAVEAQGQTPFHGRGEHLEVRLAYDFSGPRYQGTVSMKPFDIQWGGRQPLPVEVTLAVSILPRRIEITDGKLATARTQVDFHGAVTDVPTFTARFEYQTRSSLEDMEPILGVRQPPSGEMSASGAITFNGLSHYHATGKFHAARVAWHDSTVKLRDFRADGALDLDPLRLRVEGMRIAGQAEAGPQTAPALVEGRLETVVLNGASLNDLGAAGIHITTMGGVFDGRAQLKNWRTYDVAGTIDGFGARRLLALYSTQPTPWDGRISGSLDVSGSFLSKDAVAAGAHLTITPAEGGPRVEGSIDASYDGRQGTLDLGRSWLRLPATRADFSGVLGRELQVRVETRDLNDVLPALNVKTLPVRLENGSASFSGKVTGKLDDPHIAGQVAAKGLSWSGRRFDSAEASVEVSQSGLSLRKATLARGRLRAQFDAQAGLAGWKATDAGAISATGAMRGADLADLLAVAGHSNVPATGTLDASAQVSGTWGSPRAVVELAVVKGVLAGEPFDRITAKGGYSGDTFEVGSAQVDAGSRHITFSATYRHAAGDWERGRARFQIASNGMPVEQFAAVHKEHPDLAGEVRITASGEVDVAPSKAGPPDFQIVNLSADAAAGNVSVNGQRLGDAHFSASTKGAVITALLDSDFAGSAIHGEGQWRLADDYPGTARVTFSRVDFIRLEQLASRGPTAPSRVAGSMAGDIVVEGPLRRAERWKASINLGQVQLGPAPGSQFSGNGRGDFSLRNAGPVTATMADGVLRAGQARFVGRATDLALTGSLNIRQANALDLRIKGRIDLASLQDLDRDIVASGFLNTDAAIRGPLADPQVTGRLEMKNASFNLADFPNGIYNADGLIAFTGTRATIQNFTGESGGGKVRAVGFAAYENGQLVFRLGLRADQVRVRYPEGVSTVANVALNWTGDEQRSTLAGTVTVVRTGFNPQSDLSSILAKTAEPVRAPTVQTGLLSGIHLDVQIETSPDVTFESTLAQDIQLEANLRLRGTGTNPSVLGRINITQGRLVFFGTRYTINQGSISFFNPARIEPIFNVDLETKARGIDVTLTVTGPINKLNLTPRSDPPLQFSEIVALLATGRTPTSDLNLSSQQTTSTQTWQQMGASALLGQAIANPVAGRLQRFFGVTQLKIDPTLAGVDNNPQARLTLEQQVTPNITFTYMTNVTSSNPLVVQVEWALSKKWSVIAVREENGMFGMDFLYKKRF
jgi:translocation and assembly module TamB